MERTLNTLDKLLTRRIKTNRQNGGYVNVPGVRWSQGSMFRMFDVSEVCIPPCTKATLNPSNTESRELQ